MSGREQDKREDDHNPEESDSYWTEFETEDGTCGSESVDGNPVWGAKCPQPDCGEVNLFEGDPSEFAKRPYSCQSCNWVSLMHESVSDLEVLS